MTGEVDKLRATLPSANDRCSVEFEIARTWAAGGQYAQAMEWLSRVVDAGCGFDPSRDRLFAPLAAAKEFRALLEKVRSSTPAVTHSRPFTTIDQTGLSPENLAWDEATATFYIGSTVRDQVLRCRGNGACDVFEKSEAPGYVLGLKVDASRRTLWVTHNTAGRASVRQYSIDTGKLLHEFALDGEHLFNDLAITSTGTAFVTDTRAGAVYRISPSTPEPERVAPRKTFRSANGIALSTDERQLFVSAFGDGIAVIDLASESVRPMPHPAGICLAYIDGLYATKQSLIAVQNGPMVPRIVRFALSADGRAIVSMEVLERDNPLFDGITTGFLAGNRFYYIANNDAQHAPLRILVIDL